MISVITSQTSCRVIAARRLQCLWAVTAFMGTVPHTKLRLGEADTMALYHATGTLAQFLHNLR